MISEEPKSEIPFLLKFYEAGQILGISVGDVKALIRSKQLETVSTSAGPKVLTESVIEYLGRREFRRRWPSKLGKVRFEEEAKGRKRARR